MWKEKVLTEAKAQREADAEFMRNELDWYVGRVIFRMPTSDYIKLLDEVIGLEKFFEMRMSNGTPIKALIRNEVENAVLAK